MSRTTLFESVTRSLRLARLSLDGERSPAELVEEAHAAGVTRRRFLEVTAPAVTAALAASAVPAWARTRSRDDDPVLVVGAGIAGLTAAYRLRQAGVPVRVVEAQNRVGGRMFSLRDFFPGQVVELGGELIDSGQTHIRSLAAELGLELDDLEREDSSLARLVLHFGGSRRSDAEIVQAFRPVAAAIDASLATIQGDDVTYRDPAGAAPLDRMSIAEWLDHAGIQGWERTMLDVAYTTEYGIELDRQSVLNLLLLIGEQPDPMKLYGESDERFHTRGGNDQIPRLLAQRLEDAIETAMRLEAVRRTPAGGYACSFRQGGSSRTITASRVLLAIPFTLLRQVKLDVELPPAKRRAIAELGYGTNAKLMVGFQRRVWHDAASNGSALTDLPFQCTWDTTRQQPGAAGVLTNFVGGRHGVAIGRGTAEEQAARFIADLDRVFPGAEAAHAGMKAVRFHWPTFPYTLGSYAGYLVGQWTGFGGAEGETVDGLYFAGEHCSRAAQGFMEGGCETGEAAARAILAGMGVQVERTGMGRATLSRRELLARRPRAATIAGGG